MDHSLFVSGAVIRGLLQVHKVPAGWSLETSLEWPEFLSLPLLHEPAEGRISGIEQEDQ